MRRPLNRLGAGWKAKKAEDQPGYYPPALTGLRGDHPGCFEAAYALRDGAIRPPITPATEQYDLVVVGGGISGLSAALA